MIGFFWPEYSCNNDAQVIITEDDAKCSSSVSYLEGYEPVNESDNQ